MKTHTIKAGYFATICLPPPLLLVLYPMVFLWHVQFPSVVIAYYPFYFWIGLLLLLVDLWRSKRSTRMKVQWTILNTILGVVCLPIYWFRHVLSARNGVQSVANATQ